MAKWKLLEIQRQLAKLSPADRQALMRNQRDAASALMGASELEQRFQEDPGPQIAEEPAPVTRTRTQATQSPDITAPVHGETPFLPQRLVEDLYGLATQPTGAARTIVSERERREREGRLTPDEWTLAAIGLGAGAGAAVQPIIRSGRAAVESGKGLLRKSLQQTAARTPKPRPFTEAASPSTIRHEQIDLGTKPTTPDFFPRTGSLSDSMADWWEGQAARSKIVDQRMREWEAMADRDRLLENLTPQERAALEPLRPLPDVDWITDVPRPPASDKLSPSDWPGTHWGQGPRMPAPPLTGGLETRGHRGGRAGGYGEVPAPPPEGRGLVETQAMLAARIAAGREAQESGDLAMELMTTRPGAAMLLKKHPETYDPRYDPRLDIFPHFDDVSLADDAILNQSSGGVAMRRRAHRPGSTFGDALRTGIEAERLAATGGYPKVGSKTGGLETRGRDAPYTSGPHAEYLTETPLMDARIEAQSEKLRLQANARAHRRVQRQTRRAERPQREELAETRGGRPVPVDQPAQGYPTPLSAQELRAMDEARQAVVPDPKWYGRDMRPSRIHKPVARGEAMGYEGDPFTMSQWEAYKRYLQRVLGPDRAEAHAQRLERGAPELVPAAARGHLYGPGPSGGAGLPGPGSRMPGVERHPVAERMHMPGRRGADPYAEPTRRDVKYESAEGPMTRDDALRQIMEHDAPGVMPVGRTLGVQPPGLGRAGKRRLEAFDEIAADVREKIRLSDTQGYSTTADGMDDAMEHLGGWEEALRLYRGGAVGQGKGIFATTKPGPKIGKATPWEEGGEWEQQLTREAARQSAKKSAKETTKAPPKNKP